MTELEKQLEHNWLSVYDELSPEEYKDLDGKEYFLEDEEEERNE